MQWKVFIGTEMLELYYWKSLNTLRQMCSSQIILDNSDKMFSRISKRCIFIVGAVSSKAEIHDGRSLIHKARQICLKRFERRTYVNTKKSFLPSNKRPFALALAATAAEFTSEGLNFICISSTRRRDSSHFCLCELGNATTLVYYVKHLNRVLITSCEIIHPVSACLYVVEIKSNISGTAINTEIFKSARFLSWLKI